jgi:hypothetical protein
VQSYSFFFDYARKLWKKMLGMGIGYGLLVIGYGLLAMGYWLWVKG